MRIRRVGKGAYAPCPPTQSRRQLKMVGTLPLCPPDDFRPSLRAQRSDPSWPRKERMDCFVARAPRNDEATGQFLVLSTSAPFLIHGIMSRSLAPTSSIGCWESLARVALNEVWLTLFSSIQSRANLPDWMSARTRFISAFLSAGPNRGAAARSPDSCVIAREG